MRELSISEANQVSGGLAFLPLLAAAPTGAKLFVAGAVFGSSLMAAIYKMV